MAIGDELASLDFEAMIGGPLEAMIRAQAAAAVTSVDFIKEVGFENDDKGPTMVTFTYDKPVETTDPVSGAVTVEVKPFTLTVPFLTMLPIPFIRIEEATIDFNAKILSVQERKSASERLFKAALSAKAGWGWGSAKLKVSYSSKRTTSATSKTERTYSIAVHVRVRQDELPEGTSRLLGILESVITEVPATP